jgi:hypothetical protein
MKTIAITLLLTSNAVADPEAEVSVLPCRPTIACTAEIVPQGTVEVETGYAQRRGTGDAIGSLQALVKYSVTDRVQLQVGTNNVTSVDGAYLGPKVVLHAQTEYAPAISLSALVMLPTRSDTDAMTRTTDGYFWAYASKDLLTIHADFNVGVNVLSMTDKPATQVLAALSLSRDIGHGVGAMLEGYAFEGGAPYGTHDAGILTGLTYSITPRMMLDAGVDIALYRDVRNLTLFGGVTFIPFSARSE